MSLPIHTTAGNHAGPKSYRGLEVYATSACAVEALIRAEPLRSVCWEAAVKKRARSQWCFASMAGASSAALRVFAMDS